MSQNEQYENLSGVKISYEDNNLQMNSTTSEQAATEAVLIIGTALDGPLDEVISVNALGGPKVAEKLFGGLLERRKVMANGEEKTVKVPHQGTLVRKMWEAVRAGSEDVRLMRISGQAAKTELPAKDPNSEVTQPLADLAGNQLIPGNVAFSQTIKLSNDQRLVKIEKIEEYAGTDITAEPVKTYPDASGYQSVITDTGSEAVFFSRDKFRPKNTVKVTYKAKKRNYTEVTRSMDGVAKPETLGLLTQNPTMTNYFSSEVSNWSDDPLHSVNVYVIDSKGSVNAIPSVSPSGNYLYRIGKEDTDVTDELKTPTTAKEFKQGGIRFTSEYQAEVANGLYPPLTGVKVVADYYYYNDLEIQGTTTALVPGVEKETFLKFVPETDSLEVYYELGGMKYTLAKDTDYTIIFPDTPQEKITVMIKAGAGPVGAKLFSHYKTGENGTQGAKLIVNAQNPGELYASIENTKDLTSLVGVKVTVEYEVNTNGTIDMENRVIRFIKPADKKLTSNDNEMVFRTKELPGIRTLREFANYVNGLSKNNIVSLDVPLKAGDVPVAGLVVTDYTISQITGLYEYRPINLGEFYDEVTGNFHLYVDDSKPEGSMERFPWLGSNGFFSTDSLLDMKNYYELLSGKYELIEGTLDEYELIEQGIFSKLENYSTDIIVLADVFANTAIGGYAEDGSLIIDQTKNFATALAQHCALVTAKTNETIGVIGMAPAPVAKLRDIQAYIDLVVKGASLGEEMEEYYKSRGINPGFVNVHNMFNVSTHEEIFNDDGEPIDIGRYVNVVFGPEVGLAHEKLGNYVSDGSVVYAALISQTAAEISTTNAQLDAAGLRYTLSESQHNQLAGARFVTFDSQQMDNNARVIVVKEGVTAAAAGSDYERLSALRIVHATTKLVRRAATKFIGKPNNASNRNSLATEIQAILDKLKEKEVLENFQFTIYSSARDKVLGNSFITLELVPAYEIRKIFTSVALRASL